MPAVERPPLVRLEDLSGEDSWAWAVRVMRAVVDADSSSDAFIDAGRLLQQLDPAALLDIAITLALVPRFGLGHLSTENLDDLVARMALAWPRDEP